MRTLKIGYSGQMILRVFLFSLMLSFATPNASAGISCKFLFERKTEQTALQQAIKSSVLQNAVSKTKIQLTSDQKYIDKVLGHWDLDNSSPAKVERVAQSIVLKLDKKRTFLQWLKGIVYRGDVLKEATRVRAETLLLKQEMLEGLATRGYAHKNTKFDNYRGFRANHFNKIQMAKFLAVNAVFLHYLGIPLYFPSFDLIKNMNLTQEDIDLVQNKGFETAYKTILSRHKIQTIPQRIFDHAPQAFFLSVLTYTSYNYFKVQVQESHYEITAENTIPQSNVLFKEWQKNYEEQNGRKPDLKNAQDRKAWDATVLSIYRAWADLFNEKEGRYPDLSKEQDRLAWEKFLASVQP